MLCLHPLRVKPLFESLRGCDPMQIDRLSSSSSGGRLRSSHTHLALTPLRLDPSVSIPWSTLSCLDEQETFAIINTSLKVRATFFIIGENYFVNAIRIIVGKL